jgi:mycobactin lysine-N-oxygenase
MHRIVVIGAGPKGLALHVKSRALRELGVDAPEVVMIERHAVGAHWAGGHGYTDGARILCTSAEKDLGYPYRSTFGREVDGIVSRHSWPAFKISRGTYAAWVDEHADRRLPDHREWTSYLKWVAAESDATIIEGEVERADAKERFWSVRYRDAEARRELIEGSGLVLTGPGDAKELAHQDSDARISDGRSFWLPANVEKIRAMTTGRIAVIGSGETAGTILCGLLELLGKRDVALHYYTRSWPQVRSAGHWANRYLTDPGEWPNEPLDKRLEFIAGTDKGKLSPRTHELIDRAARELRINQIRGYVTHAKASPEGIVLSGTDLRTPISATYDHVVVAKGFDPLSTIAPVWPKPPKWSGRADQREARLSSLIDYDLSVTGMAPKLHIPMLAAREQGPGFPRLCCLGVMSDRIVGSYLTRNTDLA